MSRGLGGGVATALFDPTRKTVVGLPALEWTLLSSIAEITECDDGLDRTDVTF